ncbi:aminopeptidase P family protein [Streptomyces lunaelactis]|uniref:aminopeptidase P family protein n=1 Tax=Streptomyces lunaelactis TaxID=1535768 RepID=UPI0015859B91|nr:aminopeptidase P family protein [Streptomyces lunaelactis]NUK34171.1 aminopeptidase P family protein [Streptomyces lunaelactis]NUK40105.1 aminopeptidase P family protein [Streptomyces lunaelactis]NUK56462.1 aminopeptidase P family protein [Streptomyces lunaelactis]NUK63853.1 aminopeptidase P family protein [Streptomyces lunaelactis]NUK77362.1 aminopeptidase P family protein [Streptomyces lunaelactis]
MTQPALRTGSHDLTPSAELQAFMARDWAAGPLPGELLLPAARFTPSRRARLSGRFPGERLLIPAGGLTVRSNDCDYRFRPHSAYAWLTGLTGEDQAGHVLVLEPSGPSGHEAVLHVRPRSPRDGGEEFYRDRRYGEFWVGRRPDLAEAERMTGIRCEHLDAYGKLPPGRDATHDAELASVLSELRLIKDAWEVDQLQLAVDHTASGFEDVVRALPRALSHPRGERWIEGVFGLRARAEGNGTGYDTIAASGAHACVLHWIRNDGALDPQKLLLLDAGVETDSLYTADITRTLPLSGRFSFLQLQVYELVLAAQEAGMAALRPGASFRDFHRAGMRVIAEGLAEWGILKSPEGDLHRRYTLCSSGHMLGVDVHDCAQARSETYLDGVLSEGNVLTVEPGLYFQPDDETLPAELRGIGVRIEDDLVITEDGARLMSGALPRTPDGIESWMGELLDG